MKYFMIHQTDNYRHQIIADNYLEALQEYLESADYDQYQPEIEIQECDEDLVTFGEVKTLIVKRQVSFIIEGSK